MAGSFRVPEELPVPRTSSRGGEPDHPLLVQVALSRAASLARVGRYEEAEKLLSELRLSSAQAIPVLHLRARILAQQGRLLEAAEDWKRVLSAEPRHEGAAAGLREVAFILRRPAWIGALLSWPMAGSLLLGLLAIAVFARGSSRTDPVPATEIRRVAADLERIRGSQERIEERLGRSGGAVEARKPPAFDPGIPGITLKPDGEDLVVLFREPLFDPGNAELRASARGPVADLGAKLAPEVKRIHVRILLEPGKPAMESQALAFSRARALMDQLRKSTPAGLVVTMETRGLDPVESSMIPDPAVGLRLSAARN